MKYFSQVLDVWCDKMPCVTAPERRKLLALALASLLTTESPVVLQRVYIVFLNIVETLNDVTKTDDVGATVDSLMAGVGDVVLDTDDIDYETEHDSRKRQIAMQVGALPFFTISLCYLPGSCAHDCAEGVRASPGDKNGPAAWGDQLQGDHYEC